MHVDRLTELSAAELARLVKARGVSSVEVIEAYRERIERFNPALNAIVTLAPDLLDQAREADLAIARGDAVGPLHGVPITIKDTIETVGLLTTSGSRLRASYVPAQDADSVTRLKAAGAIILGKTNTPEMAIPYETDNPVFGRTNNPYDLERTPGGSSGGEAAAIAACLSPAGLGSDLSGSIRVPAHFSGIAGLRPTSGRISMEGHMPRSPGALAFGACIGPMARRVEDLSLLFNVLALSSAEVTAPVRPDLRGRRLGWYDYDGVTPVTEETKLAVQAAVKGLGLAGLEIIDERPPAVEFGSRLWIDLFSRPSAAKLREFYSGREGEAGPVAGKIIDRSDAHVSAEASADEDALRERERLREQLLEWMETTPLIVAPVGATAAFEHGVKTVDVAGESVSVFRAFSYAQTFNVFDLPSVVVCAGQTAAGLPIGVQIVGRPYAEHEVLAAASIIEAALGGWRPPPMFGTNTSLLPKSASDPI